jgi:hypothetical protein
MGLDMYLTKKTYIGAEFKHRNVKGAVFITINDKPLNIKLERLSEIVESIGCWRKQHDLHKWFVDNIQKGIDDCGEYPVETKELQGLLDVIENLVEENDLERTKQILEEALKEKDNAIYYRSSW